MRKKQLKADLEAERLQNAILRARHAVLEAVSDELGAEIDKREDWFSPDLLPQIVEIVLDELVTQLGDLTPQSQAFHVYINGKDVTKAEIDKALKAQVNSAAAAFGL